MPDISSLLSGGGAVAQPVDRRVVRQSMTYKATVTGTLVGRAFGASGSGGLTHGIGCATGPGAGEVVDFVVAVSAGDDIVFTMGAGGAAVTRTTAGQTNGNDGADSTITGPNGLSITVVAGKKGLAGPVSAGTPLAGGAGGTGGTGGASHRPGGRGGNIANCNGGIVTGGGAHNLTTTMTSDATRGGDVTVAPQPGVAATATGGGSPGGRGADFNGAGSFGVTAGAGMGGNAIDGVDAAAGKCGPNILGQRSATAVTAISAATAPFGLDLSGNGADATNAAGPGGGGKGSSNGTHADVAPGIFGGFGGLINQSTGQVGSTSLPFYGAPGGQYGTGTSTTLKGCDAVVFLALYPKA